MINRNSIVLPVLLLAAIVSAPSAAREDPRYQLRYVEAINQEASLTDRYQQPVKGETAASDREQQIETVAQALQRLRQLIRPVR